MAEEVKKATKAKKAPKAEKKVEEKKVFADPLPHDYEVIYAPIITEKCYALLETGKITVKVNPKATKGSIKASFERLYQAEVKDVKVMNVAPKKKSRGGRYEGKVSGYKKAIITLKDANAVTLFKE